MTKDLIVFAIKIGVVGIFIMMFNEIVNKVSIGMLGMFFLGISLGISYAISEIEY